MNFSDLEKISSDIKKSDFSVGVLGNSGLLSLDPVEDKTPLYNQLLQTYNWNERVSSKYLEYTVNLIIMIIYSS